MADLVDAAHAGGELAEAADLVLGLAGGLSDVADAGRAKAGIGGEHRRDGVPELLVRRGHPHLVAGEADPGAVEGEGAVAGEALEEGGEGGCGQARLEGGAQALQADAHEVGIVAVKVGEGGEERALDAGGGVARHG